LPCITISFTPSPLYILQSYSTLTLPHPWLKALVPCDKGPLSRLGCDLDVGLRGWEEDRAAGTATFTIKVCRVKATYDEDGEGKRNLGTKESHKGMMEEGMYKFA